MNDGIAAGVLAELGDVYSLGGRIIRSTANFVSTLRALNGKGKVPDSVRLDLPRILLPVLDRQEIVRIIRPDLILVGIGVFALLTTGRIVAIDDSGLTGHRLVIQGGIAGTLSITVGSRALASDEKQGTRTRGEDESMNSRRAAEQVV